jgi:hypothetical protein
MAYKPRVLALADGGTNSSLIASNGGIFYSTNTAGAILAGTATANQLLMSGASTTPAWSTATYPATNSQGDLIIGSSTNVLSGLAIGSTAGQFLASNGTTPFWFVNTQNILMRDDFFASSGGVSDIGFNTGGGGSGGGNKPDTTNGTNAHPGVWSVFSSGVFANWTLNTAAVFYFGGGAIIADFVAKIPTLSTASDRVDFCIGFTDGAEPGVTNGVFFHYRDNLNSGKWVLQTTAASTTTTTNTASTVDTNWHRYTITVNAAATSVTFSIDGSSVGTIATNIPTAGGTAGLRATFSSINAGASTGAQMLIVGDLFSYYQALTVAR